MPLKCSCKKCDWYQLWGQGDQYRNNETERPAGRNTTKPVMSLCMTEDQYVHKMMEWASRREKKIDWDSSSAYRKTRRDENLKSANTNSSDTVIPQSSNARLCAAKVKARYGWEGEKLLSFSASPTLPLQASLQPSSKHCYVSSSMRTPFSEAWYTVLTILIKPWK